MSTTPAASSQLIFFDTTLRDGEQSPGVHLTGPQKVVIGKQLARLGVNVCEIGFPACAVDLDAVHQLVREIGSFTEGRVDGQPMTLAVLARCVPSDIDAAWSVVSSAARPRIHIFYATSNLHLEYKLKKTKEQALETIAKMVAYARSKCSDIEFSAEDASRTDLDFLIQVVTVAIQQGATTINLPDTVGTAIPYAYGELVASVRREVAKTIPTEIFSKIIFSVHCHNDLGLATGNTLAAVAAGARQVEVTINGIGERAGNTALEEIVMAVKVRPDCFPGVTHTINTKLLVPTSQLVSSLSGMIVQKNKAIVGANCVLHESGVHVDGILKNRATYEIFSAEEVGWSVSSGIVLGKHSGRAAYRQALLDVGIAFKSDEHLAVAFGRFQELVTASTDGVTITTEQLIGTTTQTPKIAPLSEQQQKVAEDGTIHNNNAQQIVV